MPKSDGIATDDDESINSVPKSPAKPTNHVADKKTTVGKRKRIPEDSEESDGKEKEKKKKKRKKDREDFHDYVEPDDGGGDDGVEGDSSSPPFYVTSGEEEDEDEDEAVEDDDDNDTDYEMDDKKLKRLLKRVRRETKPPRITMKYLYGELRRIKPMLQRIEHKLDQLSSSKSASSSVVVGGKTSKGTK